MAEGNGNGTVKLETVRWAVSIALAGLVAYFTANAAMETRVAVLESATKPANAQIAELTNEVATLNRQVAVLTAIVERIESRQNVGRR